MKRISKMRKMLILLRKKRQVNNRHTYVMNSCIMKGLLYLAFVDDFIEVEVEFVSGKVLPFLQAESDQLLQHE